MDTPKMLIEIAGVVGLTIVIIQCVKLKYKIPGPIYPLLMLLIAVPLNIINVYLMVWMTPLMSYAVQGAVISVLVASGVVSAGKKMFEK